MQTFYHHNIYWEVDWDISNHNKPYSNTEDNYKLTVEYKNLTLLELCISLKRKPTSIVSKLRNLKILEFSTESQKNWNTIYNCLDTLTIPQLQAKLDNKYPLTKEQQEIVEEINKNPSSAFIDGSFYKYKFNYTKQENKMNRTSVIVELFDDTEGLDVKQSRVLSEEVIVEIDDKNLVIQQVMLEHDVASIIKKHNELRAKTVDEKILQNTGNQVMLREVKISDLRWSVK